MFSVQRMFPCKQAGKECSTLDKGPVKGSLSIADTSIEEALVDDFVFWTAAISAYTVLHSIQQIAGTVAPVALGAAVQGMSLATDVCAGDESWNTVLLFKQHQDKTQLIAKRLESFKGKEMLVRVIKSNQSPAMPGQELLANSVCIRCEQTRLMIHQKKSSSVYVALLRDTLLQLAKVGARIANSISILTDLVHVSSVAAGVAAGALGIAGGCLQIVQGAFDYFRGSVAIRAAGHFLEKVGDLYLEKMPDILGLLDEPEAGAANQDHIPGIRDKAFLDCLQCLPKEERFHLQKLYAIVCNHLENNHKGELKSQETIVYRAKVRMIYGAITVAIGVTSLVLSVTGVGGIAVGVVVLLVGSALGVAWLTYAIYRLLEKRSNKMSKAEEKVRCQNQTNSAAGSLASLETAVKDGGGQNSFLLARMLLTQLTSRIDKSVAGKLLPQTDLSAEQLACRARRHAAHFILSWAGMQEQDIQELEDKENTDEAINDGVFCIRLYLSKGGGRASWMDHVSAT